MEEQSQSGLGIASFITSLLAGFLLFALIGVGVYQETSTPGGLPEDSPVVMLVGLALLGLIGLEFVAAGLGIAALFQEDRKKSLAILGILFSLGMLCAIAGLLVLGSVVE